MIIQHTHTDKGGSFYIGEPSSPTAQLVYRMAGMHEQTTGLLTEGPSSDVFAPEAIFPPGARPKNIMIIEHTEVTEVHKGEGIGTHLVAEAANYARQHQIKILPLCSFARSVMQHSKEYEDLLLTADSH
jgi:hypothetical protein